MAKHRKSSRGGGVNRDLQRQTDKQQKTKDKSNKFSFSTFYDISKFSNSISQYIPKIAGTYYFDVIPYIADKGNQDVEPGKPSYVLDLMIHRNIGPKKEQFVCPLQNYKEDCPICDFMSKNRLVKEDWQAVKATRMVMYFVWWHHDPKEEKKGVQLFVASHFLTEQKFLDRARDPITGGSIVFADTKHGKMCSFEIKGEKKQKTWEAQNLIDRRGDGKIPKKILKQVEGLSLESICNLRPSSKEIAKAFNKMKDSLRVEGSEKVEDDMMSDDVPFYEDKKSKKDKKRKKTNIDDYNEGGKKRKKEKSSSKSSSKKSKKDKKQK